MPELVPPVPELVPQSVLVPELPGSVLAEVAVVMVMVPARRRLSGAYVVFDYIHFHIFLV